MKTRHSNPLLLLLLLLVLVSLACAALQPVPTSTPAPTETETATVTPTNTPRPSPTLRPSRTPDLAATQHVDELNAEVQKYFDLGYLRTTAGRFVEYPDFREEWAQLGWYSRWVYQDRASDLYMSGHLTWSSAYSKADLSGCGFVFAEQKNGEHYAVFLDKSQVLLLQTDYFYYPIRPTRGTGRVQFDNPADHPVEADLAVIVKGAYAYVLVNGKLAGGYTLSQSRNLYGQVGVALLSGTNKGYGTRCRITGLHLWIPNP
jgi:hypothetical protein